MNTMPLSSLGQAPVEPPAAAPVAPMTPAAPMGPAAPMTPAPAMPQAEPSSQGYNGVVSVQGHPVPVKNGVADIGGEQFYVSHDGNIVVNQQRQLIGIIQNGKFMEATPEIINQLQHAGLLQAPGQPAAPAAPSAPPATPAQGMPNVQPQGMAPPAA